MLTDEDREIIATIVREENERLTCIILGVYCIEDINRNHFANALAYAKAHATITGSSALIDRVREAEIDFNRRQIEALEKC